MSREINQKEPAERDEDASRFLDEPPSVEEEVERWRGVPKTPQGWWTLGLTVMAILIAIALWLRFV